MKKQVYKFCHLSDLHLGAKPKGIRQRKIDIFDAFSWSIDRAIEENVNGVLLCGDTFHTKIVDWEVVNKFNIEYNRLDDNNVDLIVIPGNHDFVAEYEWTRTYPNIIDPGSGYHESPYINFYSVDWDTIPNTTKVVDRLKKTVDKGCFNVLMMHQAVEGHIFRDEKKSFLSLKYLESLKQYFSYIALGHIHHSYIIDNFVFNPGGVEYLNISDWESKIGLFIVTVFDDKSFEYKFIETPKRKTYKFQVHLNDVVKLDKNDILCYINKETIEPHSMIYVEFFGDEELSPKLMKEVEVELILSHKPVLIKTRNFTRREKVNIKNIKDDPFQVVFGKDTDLAKHIAQEQNINLNEL